MKRLLEEIDSKHLAHQVTTFLRENIVREVERNEYNIEIKNQLLTINQVNKLSRKSLAQRFYTHRDSNGIKRKVEKYASKNNLGIDSVTEPMLKLITNEIDYRLPFAYALEYTGNTSLIVRRNFIKSKGLKFKYKYGQEKFNQEEEKYEERVKSQKATRSQISYLTKLLIQNNMSITRDVKTLDHVTVSTIIDHLVTGAVLDEETQRMLVVY